MTIAAAPALTLAPSPEERAFRETIHAITAAYGPAYYKKCYVENRTPVELWRELGEGGYLSVHLPEEYGGGGGGIADLAAMLEETAAAGCPLMALLVTPGIVAPIIQRHGTEQQRREWLPEIGAGRLRFALGMTEPGAGSNTHNIATTARRDGDRYIVNGQKYYISGADTADYILLVTRTGTDAKGRGQITMLAVDRDAPGLVRQPIETALEEPEHQFTLFLDDVEVPVERRLGEEGHGLRALFDGLNPERILVAAVSNGIARYALEKSAEYARTRKVWGDTPIGAHQGVAHPLAEGKIKLEQSTLVTSKAAALYDAGLPAGEASNIAKLASAETGIFCLDQAIQTHGGNGMAREYDLTSYWWLTRIQTIAPVSRQMILNYIAEHSLGLPKSY
ncbi:acyl-CoA dehydrogenase [Mycolicibacterium moriokaense]|uniref:Acyl-CoA dehydrogenase FadE n=1 Tax=Mycolicibacterium moriokaense TaxID=39691 RepID=A0AAD1H884_9MYCO|nr:acyl-CoA dehydrogenase family protein [Mycolicibacterium moriokaense]MCV7039167.1 acyl-CoA/acyl-ACP dehydrogenase [Mycolicibacterium moriokaense]ORB18549.1 acyl-CoA dehydrogenase [Mycolicibacterium moriokaense]BBX00071.1 putative acyl-CoA dehydrogenase FadE [Mycolicibacterium moriokaense]